MTQNKAQRRGRSATPAPRSQGRYPAGSGSGRRPDKPRAGRRPGSALPQQKQFESKTRKYNPQMETKAGRPGRQTVPAAGPIDRLEGRNPIREALRAGRNINKIWIKRRDGGKTDPDLAQLIQECRRAGAVTVEVTAEVLDSMATSYGHQGIIAQVAAHEYIPLPDLIARGEAQQEQGIYPLLILLDGLEESYNLGSILRIADAAGATGIIIPERRSVALDATVAKASAGAIEHVPVARVTNLSATIRTLKEAGYWIYGADAAGTARPEDSDWLRSIALVIGSEGKGMSAKITAACDHLVSIPQYGKVNSLNAAVACGILTYEARRQARNQDRSISIATTAETGDRNSDTDTIISVGTGNQNSDKDTTAAEVL